MLVGVPGWVFGVAVVLVVGFAVAKLLFRGTAAAIDGAKMSGARAKDRQAALSMIANGKREIAAELRATLPGASTLSEEQFLSREVKSNQEAAVVMKALLDKFEIEVFDPDVILGKTVRRLLELAEWQMNAYCVRAGVL